MPYCKELGELLIVQPLAPRDVSLKELHPCPPSSPPCPVGGSKSNHIGRIQYHPILDQSDFMLDHFDIGSIWIRVQMDPMAMDNGPPAPPTPDDPLHPCPPAPLDLSLGVGGSGRWDRISTSESSAICIQGVALGSPLVGAGEKPPLD